MARKHKKEHHEEHIDESWLIPYADLLTLLLALFIVLFASSQVDSQKFASMAASFNSALGGGGGPAGLAILDGGNSMMAPYNKSDDQGVREMQELQNEWGERSETAALKKAQKDLNGYISKSGLNGKLSTNLGQDGLLIRISESALFPSGSAELIPEAKLIGKELAKLLEGREQDIVIAGHTDNLPIANNVYPSNWELSTMRAINFMKYMLTQGKLRPDKLRVVGQGEYSPIASNLTEEGRAKNRRVEILIMRVYKGTDKNIIDEANNLKKN
ncbi:MAG: flagellar motor protein MotB [bacterium]